MLITLTEHCFVFCEGKDVIIFLKGGNFLGIKFLQQCFDLAVMQVWLGLESCCFCFLNHREHGVTRTRTQRFLDNLLE
jgi:hypothetical protein